MADKLTRPGLSFEEVRALLKKSIPEEICEEMGVECGTCYMEALIASMTYRALKGDVAAASLLVQMANPEATPMGKPEDDALSAALKEVAANM